MLTFFRNINELGTLKGMAKKQGRQVNEKDLSLIKKACLVARKGKIIWAGKESQLTTARIKSLGGLGKEVSLKGHTVLPAFVECHTHLVFGGDRRDEFEWRNQGVSYQEIAEKGGGIRSTVKATRKTTSHDLLAQAQKRVNNFTRQGVTTLECKSGYGLNAATELKVLRIHRQLKGPKIVSTFLGPHALPMEQKSTDSYLQELINKILPLVAREKLADRADIFIEKGYFTPEQAEEYFRAAKKYGLQICAHTEQLNFTNGYKTVIAADGHSADHLVQANARSIRQLAQAPLTCVLLPGADFYLQMKYPPARALIDQGARVALATDFNPGSCPTQDLSLIGLLARLEMKMTLPEVLCAYTLSAAYALGQEDHQGSLEKGKSCDFICVDGSWKDLFYQVGHHPVTQTWRAARKLSSQARR